MKIGAHFWIWAPAVTAENVGIISKVSKIGFDVVEIPVIGMEFPVKVTREELGTTSLDATVTAGCFPDTNPISPNPAIRKKAMSYLNHVLDTASNLNVNIIAGPIYSAVGDMTYIPPAKRLEWIKKAGEALKPIARRAHDMGLKLALEPLNRYDIGLVNTASEDVRLIQEIGEDSVGILLDTFHMNIEEKSFDDAIRTAGKLLYHFHTSESNRGPPGSGTVNWKQVAAALKALKYKGFGVIESFTPEHPDFSSAMRIWTPKSKSQDQLAKEGLTFLRTIFA